MTRQDAAVDVGCRKAWQRVSGVATLEHRRHTSGPEARVVIRHGGESRDGTSIRWILHNRLHVRANRAAEDIGGTREIFARNFVQLERKLKMLKAREAIRQLIDRVVRSRQRAMAAAIGHLEFEILVRLLSSFAPDQFS